VLFCERRAALVFLEQAWADNAYTAEGSQLHQKTHEIGTEVRGPLRITRGLRLRSLGLGLTGVADVVEFHLLDQVTDDQNRGTALPGIEGKWRPFPVEYKRGSLREQEEYEAQLCAQAICLEEMLDVHISGGALFFGKSAQRFQVVFGPDLREKTRAAANHLHDLMKKRHTPVARQQNKCFKCSMNSICMPTATGSTRSVFDYLMKNIEED